MILLLDNYDSFSYNLKDYFEQLGESVTVRLNDRTDADEVVALAPDAIVLSPGPRTPGDAGCTLELIERFHHNIPMLGICLGHQAIGEYFGAELVKGRAPVHGKTALMRYQSHPLFEGLPNPFQVMRYHSLVLRSLDRSPLEVLGRTTEGVVMAIKHCEHPVYGLQFHPESILSPQGLDLLANWLKLASDYKSLKG